MSSNYIKSEDSLPEIKRTVFDLLKRAAADNRSAMHFVTLATIKNDTPNLRTVVLRNFNENDQAAIIYTDERSSKVHELKENKNATILAYDKGHKIQLKLIGEAHVHHQNDLALSHWLNLKGGKEAYNTTKAPGSEVKSLERAHTFKKEFDEEHFAVIEFNIKVIAVLQLNGSEHIRVCIDLKNNKSSWLVP
ncbi:pyridoxamine 5'-phosphate oxidase family protein [Marivirga atlantica]|uniref:Pyridoxamine 5'-phosphate oxidase family protein n=1 Tax=Marivirga atlantica TaxID=1548457 RepID=A0A937AGM5_9BACT|nr:pyridoxamine 5'-phosphate oxidase family protein [Marivirga atlantica]MBL0765878.1 pyridoxamine 5'-phosphate oxidase family protein [Marivirga atlantica]